MNNIERHQAESLQCKTDLEQRRTLRDRMIKEWVSEGYKSPDDYDWRTIQIKVPASLLEAMQASALTEREENPALIAPGEEWSDLNNWFIRHVMSLIDLKQHGELFYYSGECDCFI